MRESWLGSCDGGARVAIESPYREVARAGRAWGTCWSQSRNRCLSRIRIRALGCVLRRDRRACRVLFSPSELRFALSGHVSTSSSAHRLGLYAASTRAAAHQSPRPASLCIDYRHPSSHPHIRLPRHHFPLQRLPLGLDGLEPQPFPVPSNSTSLHGHRLITTVMSPAMGE